MNPAEHQLVRRIDEGMATLAHVIRARGGEKFWCLFDRLEADREAITSRDKRLDAAISRAATNHSQAA